MMMDVIEMMVDKQAVMVMHMEVDKVTKELEEMDQEQDEGLFLCLHSHLHIANLFSTLKRHFNMMGWGGIICCVWYTGVALKLKDAPIPTKPKDPWSVETTILFSTTLKRQFNMRLCAHCEAKEFNENSLLELLGKPLSICPHLYVGIAQIFL